MAAIALLDDYQNVALSLADWSGLQKDHRIVAFKERLPDMETVARALADFEVVGIMRERTPFPGALFEKLPKLKLLITTGKRNASIDLDAAKARGVTVCATGGAGRSTADLAIGPAEVVLVSLDDVALDVTPHNVPGTIDERPNWRRRVDRWADALDETRASPAAAATITAVTTARPPR